MAPAPAPAPGQAMISPQMRLRSPAWRKTDIHQLDSLRVEGEGGQQRLVGAVTCGRPG